MILDKWFIDDMGVVIEGVFPVRRKCKKETTINNASVIKSI